MKSILFLGLAALLVVFIGFNASPVFGGDDKKEGKDAGKGSIKVKEKDEDTYWKLAKVNMSDAIKAALKEVKGTAIEASMTVDDEYLVYEIYIMDKDGKTWYVKVDAGNSKILEKECEDEDDDDDEEDED